MPGRTEAERRAELARLRPLAGYAAPAGNDPVESEAAARASIAD
ncbi:MAG TPA: hypothetical protein VKY26_06660 [Actinomycetota bacterium]|nr:hypothetical protein [Actinomycetota bacterium]